MGGGKSTGKTLQEVQNDLKNQLLTNAKDVLKKDYNADAGGTQEIRDVLKQLAMAHFKTLYKYNFNELSADIKPPRSLGTNLPAHNFCSVLGSNVGDQISGYLSQGIFDHLDLPPWMKGVATSDLTTIAKKYVNQPTATDWRMGAYSRTYDAQIEDKDSFKVDSAIVYCTASLKEDDSTANICVIYFVGVYYTVESESKETRDEIQKKAYETAAAETKSPKVPESHHELTELLDDYATKQFEEEFQYKYADNPPTKLSSSAAMIGRNSHLRYVPDLGHRNLEPEKAPGANKDEKPTETGEKHEDHEPKEGDVQEPGAKETDPEWKELRNYVEMQIFEGVNLQINSIRQKAIDDVVSVYKSILSNVATDTWVNTRIDKTYVPSDPTQNAIRQSGIIMSWYGHKTTQGGVQISVHYIYFLTIVYEELNAQQQLGKELFKEVCNNLLVHLADSKASTTDHPEVLKGYMREYATKKWNDAFGFTYNGKETTPPDMVSGKPVISMERVCILNEYPVTAKSVQEFMDLELFKRDSSGTFPPYATASIYDDIRDHILRYGSTNTFKLPNFWQEDNHFVLVFKPADRSKAVKHYGLFLYALGDLSLAKSIGLGKDKPLQEGVHIQCLFVHYMGVVVSYAEPDW